MIIWLKEGAKRTYQYLDSDGKNSKCQVLHIGSELKFKYLKISTL